MIPPKLTPTSLRCPSFFPRISFEIVFEIFQIDVRQEFTWIPPDIPPGISYNALRMLS